jgi:hypothetical protein
MRDEEGNNGSMELIGLFFVINESSNEELALQWGLVRVGGVSARTVNE